MSYLRWPILPPCSVCLVGWWGSENSAHGPAGLDAVWPASLSSTLKLLLRWMELEQMTLLGVLVDVVAVAVLAAEDLVAELGWEGLERMQGEQLGGSCYQPS